jgi:hypothetical protein
MVTGATGYLASWIVKNLLDDGIEVHATVRDPSDQFKVKHLSSIAEKSDADLKLFKADLLEPGSFEEAAANCELIIHTASPFSITNVKKPVSHKADAAPEIKGCSNGRRYRIMVRQIVVQAGDVQQQHLTFETLDRIVLLQYGFMQSDRTEAAGKDQRPGNQHNRDASDQT